MLYFMTTLAVVYVVFVWYNDAIQYNLEYNTIFFIILCVCEFNYLWPLEIWIPDTLSNVHNNYY